MARTRRLWLSSSTLAGLLLALAPSSCLIYEEDPEHCWWAAGDTTCRLYYGDTRPYCSNDSEPCGAEVPHGCVAEEPEDEECHSPCGGGVSAAEPGYCAAPEGESEAEADGDGDR